MEREWEGEGPDEPDEGELSRERKTRPKQARVSSRELVADTLLMLTARAFLVS